MLQNSLLFFQAECKMYLTLTAAQTGSDSCSYFGVHVILTDWFLFLCLALYVPDKPQSNTLSLLLSSYTYFPCFPSVIIIVVIVVYHYFGLLFLLLLHIICSLTVLCPLNSYGEHVQHFKVLKDRDGQYFIWDELFSSLNKLVDFYKSNSIAKERTVFLREAERSQRVSRRFEVWCFMICV